MESIISEKTMSANNLFGRRFLHARSMYLYCFNILPSVHYIGSINGEKAFNHFKKEYSTLIQSEHQYRCFDKKRKRFDFDETILLLNNKCIVEFNDWYCEIMHDGQNESFIASCTELVSKFKERERRKPLEINLIIENSRELMLRSMEIKRTKLNLDLFYEDDFIETDKIIQDRLNKKKDKGIVLLHGLPGTGKTTYLRYLIGKMKKRILFLSPNVAGNLMNPEFIDLLIDNPNTVLIIEDAENIIMDRKTSTNSSVSNLLNISDGLLADFLNVQLVCTFNSSITMVDTALLRKGRLIAKYEFGKLSVEKAQRLSNYFGYDQIINEPMTVAEISNQKEKSFEKDQVEIIGFRMPAKN